VRKSVPFALVEHRVQSTAAIRTSLQFNCRCSRSPNIYNSQQEDPHNVYEVPVENCLVQCHTILFIRARLQEETYCKVLSSNNNVGSVEPSGLVKGRTKDTVAESEGGSSVLKVLAVDKQYTQ
jgi:hypothetical protein